MPTRWRPALDNVPIEESLTLVVAWREGTSLEGAMVPIADEVVEELRAACVATLSDLQEREAIGYDPEAEVEREEWMAVPSRVVEQEASAVLDLLRRASALDYLSATEIPSPLWFYAAVVGDNPLQRDAFVRKADPHKSAKPGRLITALGEVLSRIDDPVFIFEQRFDLIAVEGGIAVLNQNSFELLFRETPALAARAPQWVETLAEALPFDDGAADELTDACLRDYRLLRRLRSIHERGHLSNVTMDRIREEVRRQGLEEDQLIRDGSLVADDPRTLLQLLNEDLFRGGLSDTPFQAERKISRA